MTRVQELPPLAEPPSRLVYQSGRLLCAEATLGEFSYRYDAIPSSFDLPPGPANA